MKLDIKIPTMNESFYSESASVQNKRALDTIMTKYGDYIRASSKASNVPVELIESFIFIESGGDQNAKNARAVGLMQINWSSATDILNREHRVYNNLSEEEKAILRKKLGSRLDEILKEPVGTTRMIVTTDDLYDPEFNIAVGTIYLSMLINEVIKAKGKLVLEYVVPGYNMGYFGAKKLFKKSMDEMMASIPKGTRDYVVKLVGKNGLLDVLL